jgi:hypothetical protein
MAEALQMPVHQLLHGYQDGHRLLAASTRLPDDVTMEVQRLSDASGSPLTQAFSTYITGYPLPTMAAFAIARTWAARNAPRPGCVWTHTLLFSFSDLAQIPPDAILANLFKEPQIGKGSLDYYKSPLSLQISRSDQILGSAKNNAAMWEAIYYTPTASIAVEASQPQDVETAVLGLWLMQWPGLRRNFRFCTGALRPRKTGQTPFDLQAIPREASSRFSGYSIVSPSNPASISPALLDLFRLGPSKMVEFFDFCVASASDLPETRSSFAPLLNAFNLLRKYGDASTGIPDSGVKLAFELAAIAPKPSDMSRLKRNWLSRLVNRPPLTIPNILAAGVANSYPLNEEEITAAVRDAWHEGTVDINSKWLNRSGLEMSGFLRSLLDAISGVVSQPDLAVLMRRDSALAMQLIRLNSALANDSRLWVESMPRSFEVFDIAVKRASNSDHKLIAHWIVANERVDLAIRWVRYAASPAVRTLLAALPDGSDRREWSAFFSGHPREAAQALVEFSDLESYTVEWLSPLLRPEDFHGLANVAERLIIQANRLTMLSPPEALSRFLSLVFSIGLTRAMEDGLPLLDLSFGPLNIMAAAGRLPDESRAMLADYLPALPLDQEWDYCKRLRTARERAIGSR